MTAWTPLSIDWLTSGDNTTSLNLKHRALDKLDELLRIIKTYRYKAGQMRDQQLFTYSLRFFVHPGKGRRRREWRQQSTHRAWRTGARRRSLPDNRHRQLIAVHDSGDSAVHLPGSIFVSPSLTGRCIDDWLAAKSLPHAGDNAYGQSADRTTGKEKRSPLTMAMSNPITVSHDLRPVMFRGAIQKEENVCVGFPSAHQ